MMMTCSRNVVHAKGRDVRLNWLDITYMGPVYGLLFGFIVYEIYIY